MADDLVEIVKRGETSLTVSLVRSAGGLTVSVKTHPTVEAFIQGLGSGEQMDVKASGNYWRPLRPDHPPLMAYVLGDNPQPLSLDSGDVCEIIRVGHPLIIDRADINGRKQSQINLSFLRLVGTSEGPGVTFNVRGVHTYEALTRMRELIGEAYKRFYRTYMKPVCMNIVVSTSETSV
mgnify:CR=1 FL=1